MTLIDGDRIITAQLYDDEYEEFTEKKISIIDYINAYTDEGVTEADVIEQPKWIPVSERLPKPYTWVYATCKSLVDDRENWVIDTCYVPLPKEYNSKYSDWGNILMLNRGRAEVIAWMEWIIPEPYKASSTRSESEGVTQHETDT